MKISLLAALFLFATPAIAADIVADVAMPPQRTATAALQEGGHVVAATLGQHGAWLITSQARWEAVQKSLADLKVPLNDQLRKVNFETENLVGVFHYGDEADQFIVKSVKAPANATGNVEAADVRFGMSYVIYKQRRALAMGVWKMAVIPVPKAAKTRISVWTFHPLNGGDYPTLDKARLDWEWTLAPDTAESIGNLTGAIEPKAQQIKPGEDIQLRFTLSYASGDKAKFSPFTAGAEAAVNVWDGKYSNGYRNHSFEVITPDGKSHLLRRAVQNEWGKNAPHPITIAPDKPYTLPNWAEGQELKSLKELGLDTTTPGAYTITGIYQERGEPIQNNNPTIWGGIVRTNTVVVTVK